ncbi:MAG: nucleotidyltransferase domain-containing protein [Sphingobacteriaceae bacterium]|nr:nucleotidyltransferase domain-containing protein [Sphingobacteriaceae bacterium]
MSSAPTLALQAADFGLSERELKTVQGVFSNFPEVKLVYVYGSRAKGNFKSGSDIDLAILEPATDLRLRSKLQSLFDDSHLPMRVDLVDFQSLESDSLKSHIMRVGRCIYQADR